MFIVKIKNKEVYKYSKQGILSDVDTTNENVKLLSQLVADLLRGNLRVDVAIKVEGKLEIYRSM